MEIAEPPVEQQAGGPRASGSRTRASRDHSKDDATHATPAESRSKRPLFQRPAVIILLGILAIGGILYAAADATKVKGDLQRNQQLIAGGAISKQDLEHSATDTAAAEANLSGKKKQIEAAGAYLKEAEKAAEAAHVQVEAAKAETEEAE